MFSGTALVEGLRQRLEEVHGRMAAACRRSGRASDAVTLVAVTKSVSAQVAAVLHRLGVVELGESRPQELWRKAAALPPTVHWHLVGHLQRNKIDRTLPLIQLIHSVDSLRLLDALDQEAVKQDRNISVLLEVNASEEAQKHGFAAGEISALLPHLQRLQKVRLAGLMTMAAQVADPQDCRPTFAALHALTERVAVPPPHDLHHLSMGMSNDFEVAIEEGATIVRLGTVLFEGIPGDRP